MEKQRRFLIVFFQKVVKKWRFYHFNHFFKTRLKYDVVLPCFNHFFKKRFGNDIFPFLNQFFQKLVKKWRFLAIFKSFFQKVVKKWRRFAIFIIFPESG